MKIVVITVSDRAARGEYADRSGPAIVEVLAATEPAATFETDLVPLLRHGIRMAAGESHG